METRDGVGANASEFDRGVRAALELLPGNRFDLKADADPPGVFALMGLSREHEAVEAVTLGAQFSEGTLRADTVHNQLFFFPPTPSPLAIQRAGTPEQLVNELDQWLREIVSRDVWEDEWVHRRGVFASATRLDGFGDLNMSFDDSLAPRGLKLRLLARGSYQGKWWINPRGIGAPTRSTRTRLVCWGQDGPS